MQFRFANFSYAFDRFLHSGSLRRCFPVIDIFASPNLFIVAPLHVALLKFHNREVLFLIFKIPISFKEHVLQNGSQLRENTTF